MKIHSKLLFFVLSPLFIFYSCVSTKNVKNEKSEFKNESDKADVAKNSDAEKISEKIPTAEELFIKSLDDISIFVTSAPSATVKNKPFASAFEFQVLKNGDPVFEYGVTLEYPESKNSDGEVVFAKKTFLTDEKGKIIFTPEKPAFNCASKVTVYPTPLNSDDGVLRAVKAKNISADWLVRSDIASKGAVLFIWDYDEKNVPVNNSYEILSEFRKRGMTTVGNAPVNESSYIGKPLDFLYKENYKVIGNSYGYLIFGTVKFAKPAEPREQGWSCSLISEIQAADMNDGKLIFKRIFEREATGKNWNDCVSKCKTQIARMILDEIIYGL